METCSVETGLLRKKPCGHNAVANCLNCEQPLCVTHAVPELTDTGKRSGKFMCQQCVAALKDHAKSMATVARTQQEKERTAFEKGVKASISNPAPVLTKTPGAPTPPAPTQAAPTEKSKEPDVLEFTPSSGLDYKKD